MNGGHSFGGGKRRKTDRRAGTARHTAKQKNEPDGGEGVLKGGGEPRPQRRSVQGEVGEGGLQRPRAPGGGLGRNCLGGSQTSQGPLSSTPSHPGLRLCSPAAPCAWHPCSSNGFQVDTRLF